MAELRAIALPRSSFLSTILQYEGLTNRNIESVYYPDKRLSAIMCHVWMPPVSTSAAKIERLEHGEGLGPEQEALALPPVGHHPGKRPQEQGRNLIGEGDHTQQKRRSGDPVHQPADGNLLGPCADQGDALAEEEEAVVSGTERSEDKTAPSTLVVLVKPGSK